MGTSRRPADADYAILRQISPPLYDSQSRLLLFYESVKETPFLLRFLLRNVFFLQDVFFVRNFASVKPRGMENIEGRDAILFLNRRRY